MNREQTDQLLKAIPYKKPAGWNKYRPHKGAKQRAKEMKKCTQKDS